MRREGFVLEGAGVSDLADALQDALDVEYRYDRDGIDVLFVEPYEFWRTNSNMQATVIVDREGPRSARVELVVGGGAAGLFRMTLGSEKKVMRSVFADVEAVVEELDLQLGADETTARK